MTKPEYQIVSAVALGAVVISLFAWLVHTSGPTGERPEPESEVFATVYATAHDASDYKSYLPDPTLTPGAVFKGIGVTELSKSGYTASERDVLRTLQALLQPEKQN
jgi:hypothetical protein